MNDITIGFTYFKSLTLAHLEAALYSVSRQDFSRVERVVVLDNDTLDTVEQIQGVIDGMRFPVPVALTSCKHGDASRRQSWSTNATVILANTPWVFYTRADYVLDFDILRRFVEVIDRKPDWNGFVVSNGCFLHNEIGSAWRETGPRFTGTVYDYTIIDSGVWMARLDAYNSVGGFDENLTAWGHQQTHFQWKMHKAGVEFVRIPEVLFYHLNHGGDKDITLAHQQARELGLNVNEMWARYHGPKVY